MKVADIQRFCMHDGPGVRTTVFLKGCPLSCKWCHNPETQSLKNELLYYENKCIGCGECTACKQNAHAFSKFHTLEHSLCIACGECAKNCPTGALEIVGKDYSVPELFEIIKRDSAFYCENGGVTLSGGEPFTQAEETLSLLRLCKETGIHTAVETCGYFPVEILKRAIPLTDLFLWDIKDTNSERHKSYTGVSNERIINNLYFADSYGAKTRLRCILVKGVNTNEEHYKNIADIAAQLGNCEGAEFLLYHSFGGAKTEALGKEYVVNDDWIPFEWQVVDAKNCLLQREIKVFN